MEYHGAAHQKSETFAQSWDLGEVSPNQAPAAPLAVTLWALLTTNPNTSSALVLTQQ